MANFLKLRATKQPNFTGWLSHSSTSQHALSDLYEELTGQL